MTLKLVDSIMRFLGPISSPRINSPFTGSKAELARELVGRFATLEGDAALPRRNSALEDPFVTALCLRRGLPPELGHIVSSFVDPSDHIPLAAQVKFAMSSQALKDVWIKEIGRRLGTTEGNEILCISAMHVLVTNPQCFEQRNGRLLAAFLGLMPVELAAAMDPQIISACFGVHVPKSRDWFNQNLISLNAVNFLQASLGGFHPEIREVLPLLWGNIRQDECRHSLQVSVLESTPNQTKIKAKATFGDKQWSESIFFFQPRHLDPVQACDKTKYRWRLKTNRRVKAKTVDLQNPGADFFRVIETNPLNLSLHSIEAILRSSAPSRQGQGAPSGDAE